MAFSASKRGTTPSSPSSSKEGKIPIRRSRSVSAVSITNDYVVSVSDEFLNKRDNPLYCCPPTSSSSFSFPPGSGSLSDTAKSHGSVRRGRSVSRSSEVGNQGSDTGRSLSTVDTGRRRLRSLSRDHHESLETGGHGYKLASSLRSKEDGNSFSSKVQRESAVVTTKFVAKEETRDLQTWTSKHPISQSWDASSSCSQARNWEDGISTSSFSEAEEATFSARAHPMADVSSGAIYETVRSEARRAISDFRDDLENALIEDSPMMTAENIRVIPLNFVNKDVLISDIRKEYSSKLEKSQERARKLRADLAVEEQREKELSSILKQIIIVPRKCDFLTPCPKRKASIERIRMSRRLAEEAMNYFDECVSISTFGSSDISSLEDPQPSAVIGISHVGNSRFLHSDALNFPDSNFPLVHVNHNEELENEPQSSLRFTESDIAINSSCSVGNNGILVLSSGSHVGLVDYTPRCGNNVQFSFTHDPVKTVGVHDIRQYVKKFGKGAMAEKNSKHVKVSSSYISDDYALSNKDESLVFDNLILRNRIESGSLLLCSIRIFS